MTKQQIQYFHSAATAVWTKYVSKAVDFVRQKDKCAQEYMLNSVLVRKWLAMLQCYDRADVTNCIPYDDIIIIINKIMEILGLCGELENLPAGTLTCCDELKDIETLNP